MKSFLIFDYDGTLHETMALYKSAVCETILWLKNECGQSSLPADMPDDGRFRKWIGMNADDMWEDYSPALPVELKKRAIRRVGENMIRQLSSAGRWYPGVEEMLKRLKEEGCVMLVLSNCTELYAKAHWTHFRMDRYFSAFAASESFSGIPKAQIVKEIFAGPLRDGVKFVCKAEGFEEDLKDICAEQTIMIGDRFADRNAAVENGLPFIACDYGYGREELEEEACHVEKPEEIVPLVIRLIQASKTE